MSRGVILYGPPAAGKDTVDAALCRLSPEYRHFQRLKVGPGRAEGYRPADAAELDRLRDAGLLLWENSRYGATYAVDRPSLVGAAETCTPVVHLGQPEAVDAVIAGTPSVHWTVVELWCPRLEAEQRLRDRGSRDLADRLAAWDATTPLAAPDLRIDTSEDRPDEVARLTDQQVRGT